MTINKENIQQAIVWLQDASDDEISPGSGLWHERTTLCANEYLMLKWAGMVPQWKAISTMTAVEYAIQWRLVDNKLGTLDRLHVDGVVARANDSPLIGQSSRESVLTALRDVLEEGERS